MANIKKLYFEIFNRHQYSFCLLEKVYILLILLYSQKATPGSKSLKKSFDTSYAFKPDKGSIFKLPRQLNRSGRWKHT